MLVGYSKMYLGFFANTITIFDQLGKKMIR